MNRKHTNDGDLLGNLGCLTLQAPTIGALFSGGGVRAMMSTSAAVKSLNLNGLSDVLTYTFGLSGSSWYLTYLYTHDDFGTDPLVYAKLHQQLKAAAIGNKNWAYWPCAAVLLATATILLACYVLPLQTYLLLAILATTLQIACPKQWVQVMGDLHPSHYG